MRPNPAGFRFSHARYEYTCTSCGGQIKAVVRSKPDSLTSDTSRTRWRVDIGARKQRHSVPCAPLGSRSKILHRGRGSSSSYPFSKHLDICLTCCSSRRSSNLEELRRTARSSEPSHCPGGNSLGSLQRIPSFCSRCHGESSKRSSLARTSVMDGTRNRKLHLLDARAWEKGRKPTRSEDVGSRNTG